MKKLKEDRFLLDKRQEIGSLWAIKYTALKYKSYEHTILPEIKEVDSKDRSLIRKNIEVIAGTPNYGEYDLSDPLDIAKGLVQEESLNSETFFDVLALTNQVELAKGFCEDSTQAIPTSLILELCHKYGLLNYSIQDEIWTQYKIRGFEVIDFKYRLFLLRKQFAVYMGIYNGDVIIIKSLLGRQLPPSVKDDHGILQFALEWLIKSPGMSLNVQPTIGDEGLGLQVKTSTLIMACTHFLLLMIICDDGRNLKLCPHCLNYFRYAGKGKKVYCDKCDRRTIHSRKKRAEERQKRGKGGKR